MDPLTASQKYLTKWLIRYDDEYFGYLYHDIENLAQSLSNDIFASSRSVSLYGVKGIGKTTLMQGILWSGLKNSKGEFLPVNVSVTGASSVQNQSDLEQTFYHSVLEGLLLSSEIDDQYEKIKNTLSSYAPWVSVATLAAVSLVFPPAAIAAAVATVVIKKLFTKLGYDKSESLVISNDVDYKFAVNFIIEELRKKNIRLVFAIDELDKVPNDELLSNFFDGNQGWFQGKRTIISLSYNYGNSIKDATITSVGRFSTIQKLEGIKTLEQFNSILEKRILLGISEIEPNENNAQGLSKNIFAQGVTEQIVNQSIPNLHLMLEEAFRSIKNTKDANLSQVTLNEISSYADSMITKPTPLEKDILDLLAQGKTSSGKIAESLNKGRSVISRSLGDLLEKDYVGNTTDGRNSYYFLKQKGDTSRHM